MSADLTAPKRVLAVADPADGMTAVETGHDLARKHGATLEIIVCLEPPPDLSILSRMSGANSDKLIENARQTARDNVEAKLHDIGLDSPITLSVVVGKAYLEIIRHVAKSKSDFVVKLAQPLSGLDRFLFDSTDQHLLRKCPCPVWLLTRGAPKTPRRILAAVDLDIQGATQPETVIELNRRVVHAACLIAGSSEFEIIVLHAWEAIGEGMVWAFSNTSDARLSADRYVNEILDARHREMGRLLETAKKDIGPHGRLIPRMIRGQPETVIHDQCHDASVDVVVMGTVARTGVNGVLIGNTAENIINSLDCPVLAVKPDGFVSPLLIG